MIKYIKILMLLLVTSLSFGQTITASQGWNSTAVRATEAGSNYSTTGTTTSSTSQTVLSFTGFLPASNYTVSVHQVDIDWSPNLILSIQRNTDGTGSTGGTISGGSPYITLTSSPQVFFSGNVGVGTGRTSINCAYRYIGRTVLITAKTYSTLVVYTISN